MLMNNPSPETLDEIANVADRFSKDLEKIQKKIESTDRID